MSAFGFSKVGLGAACGAALTVLLSACGSGSSTPAAGTSSGGTQSTGMVTVSASSLKTMSTSIGTVLVSPTGRTVYELVGDTTSNSTCTGGCTGIWPAVTKNGSQLVINGHPAFTFVGDTSSGQTKGQNVADQWGRWLALDAKGNPIGASSTSPSSPTSKTSAPNGGGAAF